MGTTGGGRYLVLGAGGLGCPALLGLVGSGAAQITIVDHDVVDASNLHRQVLYSVAEVGMAKVDAAALRLGGRVPALSLQPLRMRLEPDNLGPLLAAQPEGTVVLECSDAPALKFLVNDACLAYALPLVVGGVQRWRGQVQAVVHGHACLRCMFEAPPPPEMQESCSAVGVMGPAAGLLGYWMAHMAVALHAGAEVAGELWAMDTRTLAPQVLRPRPRAGCSACAGARTRRVTTDSPASVLPGACGAA